MMTVGTRAAGFVSTTTRYTTSQTVSIPSGATTMTLELWGETGIGGASQPLYGFVGGGSGSGGYSRTSMNVSAHAGQTIVLTIGAGGTLTASKAVAGTLTGFTSMTAGYGTGGTSATHSADGAGGAAGAIGTGGTAANAAGNAGKGGALGGAGGAAVAGLNGSGNAGPNADASTSVNPALPGVCVLKFV